MDIKLNKTNTNYINGTLENYKFDAKVFEQQSTFGVKKGRTSKLTIIKDNEIIANYDRGWDIEPHIEEYVDVTNEILKYIETLPIENNREFEL